MKRKIDEGQGLNKIYSSGTKFTAMVQNLQQSSRLVQNGQEFDSVL